MLDRPQRHAGRPDARPARAGAGALSGKHLIGGRFVPARSGKTFAVVNPATGEEVGQAAEGDAADVDAAVADAARGAEGMGEDAGPQARRAGRPMRRAADASTSRSSAG